MTDTEKIKLIKETIYNFWNCFNDDQQEKSAFALVSAIHAIAGFGGADDGKE